MISGRGLGHTGGTLDKLESIPGYRTELPVGRLRELVREPGGFIAGQTARAGPGRPHHVRAARRLRDGRLGAAHRQQHPQQEALRGSDRAGARRQVRPRRVHARRGGAPRRWRARWSTVARSLGPARGGAADARWTSRSDGRSATRSRSRESFEFLAGAPRRRPICDELTLALGGLMLAIARARAHDGGGRARDRRAAPRRRRARGARRDAGSRPRGETPAWSTNRSASRSPPCQSRSAAPGPPGSSRRSMPSRPAQLCVRLGGGRLRAGDAIDRGVGIVFAAQARRARRRPGRRSSRSTSPRARTRTRRSTGRRAWCASSPRRPRR